MVQASYYLRFVELCMRRSVSLLRFRGLVFALGRKEKLLCSLHQYYMQQLLLLLRALCSIK